MLKADILTSQTAINLNSQQPLASWQWACALTLSLAPWFPTQSVCLAEEMTCESLAKWLARGQATIMLLHVTDCCCHFLGALGWSLKLCGVFIADIDECALRTHTCWNDSACVNLVGGFDCLCPAGPSCSGDCPHEGGLKHNGQVWILREDRCSVCSCKVRLTGCAGSCTVLCCFFLSVHHGLLSDLIHIGQRGP